MAVGNRRFEKELGSKALSARALIDFFQIANGDAVLNVGCGRGVQLIVYWRQGAKWESACGVDSDPGIIDEAQKLGARFGLERTIFRAADAQDLPFADNSFDKILAVDVIQYLPDPEKGLSEMVRVLKVGGELLITFPSFWHLYANPPFAPEGANARAAVDRMRISFSLCVYFAEMAVTSKQVTRPTSPFARLDGFPTAPTLRDTAVLVHK